MLCKYRFSTMAFCLPCISEIDLAIVLRKQVSFVAQPVQVEASFSLSAGTAADSPQFCRAGG